MMGEIKRYKWTREQMEPLSYGSYVNYVDHAAAIRRAKAEGRLGGLKAAEIIINGCEGDFSFALFKLKQQMELEQL